MIQNRIVSVILPAYRKESVILECITRLIKTLSDDHVVFEIIVVIDGRVDSTFELISAANFPQVSVLNFQSNRGKGAALKSGVSQARGEIIVFFDADLDIHPASIVKGLEKMKGSTDLALVSGNKMHVDSSIKYPLIRRIYSRSLKIIVGVMFRVNSSDTQTGLKIFDSKVLNEVIRKSISTGYLLDLELMYLIEKRGYMHSDIAVDIEMGLNSTIKLNHILEMLRDLAFLRYEHSKIAVLIRKLR